MRNAGKGQRRAQLRTEGAMPEKSGNLDNGKALRYNTENVSKALQNSRKTAAAAGRKWEYSAGINGTEKDIMK